MSLNFKILDIYHIDNHMTFHEYHMILNGYHMTTDGHHMTLEIYHMTTDGRHMTLEVYHMTTDGRHMTLEVYHMTSTYRELDVTPQSDRVRSLLLVLAARLFELDLHRVEMHWLDLL